MALHKAICLCDISIRAAKDAVALANFHPRRAHIRCASNPYWP